MNAASPPPTSRGLARILEHCAQLAGHDDRRPSGVMRLRQAIGDELARLLITALSGDHRIRPRTA